MSHTTPPTCETASTKTEAEEEIVWPEFNPSPGYRGFIDRLRRDRKLSIEHLAERVGLGLRLANEFESIAAPLPFEFMSVWCETVGVPFADFLAIYWADEEAYAAAKEAKEREAEQPETPEMPGITSTEAGAPESETPATELSRSPRNLGFLNPVRAAFTCIASFFLSRFSTPKKTPE